jgi:hypothetical protein
MNNEVAFGIFTWNSPERRTNRYGAIYMADSDFGDTSKITPTMDMERLFALQGKMVKLSCLVVETRQSSHLCDDFLKILPTTPEVGETIELGVGPLYIESDQWSPSKFVVGIKPSDGRRKFWIDPRRLYRLHDQTVKLLVEETDEPETDDPTSEMKSHSENAMRSNGDGSFQVKVEDETGGVFIKPKFERLGGGMFMVTHPHVHGDTSSL